MFCTQCQREVEGMPSVCPHCGADLHQELWSEIRRPQRRPSFVAFSCSCLLLVLVLTTLGASVGLIVLYFLDWGLPAYPESMPASVITVGIVAGLLVGLYLAVQRFLHARPGGSRRPPALWS